MHEDQQEVVKKTSEESQEPQKPKKVVFWSKGKQHKIAGWVPAEIDGKGRITRREGDLAFHDHIHVTDDPREIEFVRKSLGFKDGRVKECGSVVEARKMTAVHDKIRAGRNDKAEVIAKDTYEPSQAAQIISAAD